MAAVPLQAGASSDALRIGGHTLSGRLIMGTGRFQDFEVMRQSLAASDTDCVTVAVRREKLHDSHGRNLLDFIDLNRYVLLPNTAGCFDASSAVRCARMGREILQGLDSPGANWVKLEVLGDSRTLLPNPIETIKATESLVSLGFEVLAYCSDDPVVAMQLKRTGAAAVMPAGSPIGSGQGVANPVNLQIIVQQLKSGDPDFPIIVDAGLGTASDAALAMELGADGVLLNSAVARATNPVLMAQAMSLAVRAGRAAWMAGRIPKSLYGSASTPEIGMFSDRPLTNADR